MPQKYIAASGLEIKANGNLQLGSIRLNDEHAQHIVNQKQAIDEGNPLGHSLKTGAGLTITDGILSVDSSGASIEGLSHDTVSDVINVAKNLHVTDGITIVEQNDSILTFQSGNFEPATISYNSGTGYKMTGINVNGNNNFIAIDSNGKLSAAVPSNSGTTFKYSHTFQDETLYASLTDTEIIKEIVSDPQGDNFQTKATSKVGKHEVLSNVQYKEDSGNNRTVRFQLNQNSIVGDVTENSNGSTKLHGLNINQDYTRLYYSSSGGGDYHLELKTGAFELTTPTISFKGLNVAGNGNFLAIDSNGFLSAAVPSSGGGGTSNFVGLSDVTPNSLANSDRTKLVYVDSQSKLNFTDKIKINTNDVTINSQTIKLSSLSNLADDKILGINANGELSVETKPSGSSITGITYNSGNDQIDVTKKMKIDNQDFQVNGIKTITTAQTTHTVDYPSSGGTNNKKISDLAGGRSNSNKIHIVQHTYHPQDQPSVTWLTLFVGQSPPEDERERLDTSAKNFWITNNIDYRLFLYGPGSFTNNPDFVYIQQDPSLLLVKYIDGTPMGEEEINSVMYYKVKGGGNEEAKMTATGAFLNNNKLKIIMRYPETLEDNGTEYTHYLKFYGTYTTGTASTTTSSVNVFNISGSTVKFPSLSSLADNKLLGINGEGEISVQEKPPTSFVGLSDVTPDSLGSTDQTKLVYVDSQSKLNFTDKIKINTNDVEINSSAIKFSALTGRADNKLLGINANGEISVESMPSAGSLTGLTYNDINNRLDVTRDMIIDDKNFQVNDNTTTTSTSNSTITVNFPGEEPSNYNITELGSSNGANLYKVHFHTNASYQYELFVGPGSSTVFRPILSNETSINFWITDNITYWVYIYPGPSTPQDRTPDYIYIEKDDPPSLLITKRSTGASADEELLSNGKTYYKIFPDTLGEVNITVQKHFLTPLEIRSTFPQTPLLSSDQHIERVHYFKYYGTYQETTTTTTTVNLLNVGSNEVQVKNLTEFAQMYDLGDTTTMAGSTESTIKIKTMYLKGRRDLQASDTSHYFTTTLPNNAVIISYHPILFDSDLPNQPFSGEQYLSFIHYNPVSKSLQLKTAQSPMRPFDSYIITIKYTEP